MNTSDFEPMLPKMVALRFPSVLDFAVERMHNVQPVEYRDHGKNRREYPPVARWSVGDKRFRYALKPTFKVERWGVLCFGGTTTRADYSDEDGKLWQLLQWSAEGKTADEINRLLGNEQPNYTVKQAQLRNAAFYRAWAARSPRNSRTRAEWLRLAETAEQVAGAAP